MQEIKADAAGSLALVAENAVALAKAELHLGLSQAKVQLLQLARVGLAAVATLLCAQVLLLLTALAPLMLHWGAWREAAICVGAAAVPTLLLVRLTRRELRQLMLVKSP